MARSYCVAHKCDNLCKNVMKGLDDYVVKKQIFKSKKSKEAQFCKGKQWMWAIHKCVGVTGPMVTDLNIYKDYYLWLQKRDRKPELMFLQALGPQVGDRFWALFHNALQIYAMRESVVEFCEERKHYAKGIKKIENNLIKTIREIGTVLLPKGPFKLSQMIRILAEVRACAAWQVALFGPCLLIASRMLTINPSSEFITAIQHFLYKVVNCPEFARRLITWQAVPFTFLAGTDIKMDKTMSESS